jgi:acyl-coenzyme A thioesterase PaaI-like protein
MSLLEKIQSMKMPFAELKGVNFTRADKDRVVAKMLVRPDLCTFKNDSRWRGDGVCGFGRRRRRRHPAEGAGAPPAIESKTNFIGGARRKHGDRHRSTPVHRGRRTGLADPSGDRGWQLVDRHPDPDGADTAGAQPLVAIWLTKTDFI